MLTLLTTILFVGCTAFAQAQSMILEQLKEEKKTNLKLFFYPSTLRMLSMKENKDYYEMIKGIRRLTFFRMDPEKFTPEDFTDTYEHLQSQEKYEPYIAIESERDKTWVVGRSQPPGLVVLRRDNEDLYIAEVQGTIDIFKLPEVYRSLSRQDTTLDSGFINVFELMNVFPEENQEQVPEANETPDSLKQQKRS